MQARLRMCDANLGNIIWNRQAAEAVRIVLRKSWNRHGATPALPRRFSPSFLKIR